MKNYALYTAINKNNWKRVDSLLKRFNKRISHGSIIMVGILVSRW